MKRISLLRWVLWFNTNKLNLINSPNEVSKHALVPQYFCPETGDLGEVSVDFDFSKAKSVINTIDNTRKTNVATANIMIQQTGLPRRLLLNSTVSSSNRFILLWILWQSGYNVWNNNIGLLIYSVTLTQTLTWARQLVVTQLCQVTQLCESRVTTWRS